MAAKSKAPKSTSSRLSFKNEAELLAYVQKQKLNPAENYRLVRRDGKPAKSRPAADDNNEPAPITPNGVWGPQPSVPRQLAAHPDTVRNKATQTRQFILSNPEHLEAWNELQTRMHPMDAPQIHLSVYESQFAPSLGSFVLHVSYAELEYQQLI